MDNTFSNELQFEKAFINLLSSDCGWATEVLHKPTERDLLENWKKILYNNNRSIDRLGDYPLTDGEIAQVIEKINTLHSPFALNSFINGTSVSIKRDNPDDKAHFGKEVTLHIYDRQEIAGGKSCYQIAEQPVLNIRDSLLPQRRGDVMLLINGMPVFHIELKGNGVPISNAWNQIEKYSKEGAFSGIYSLIQIFVAMTPEDVVYFTNPGPDGVFNKSYYFHWENPDNVPVHDWNKFTRDLLKIPMAHMLIGFYMVADKTDGILKVLRSYQYNAVVQIANVVAKNKWGDNIQRGGYIWHTTGSGKTLTSFKTAELISRTNDADKVVFLVDRTELDTQSLLQYKNFMVEDNPVEGVDNTNVLISKLKATEPKLIIASIQKMSRVKIDGKRDKDIQNIKKKRIVFIVDECHRDTFGKMMLAIKATFTDALFFGFTGTPILNKNAKNGIATTDVFGNELHRYTIGDGIRDGNVLGFDPYKILTFQDTEIKTKIALEKVKANSVEELKKDPKKEAKFYKILKKIDMAGHVNNKGKYISGAEDRLEKYKQYQTNAHTNAVVEDIIGRYNMVSCNKKFHSIFATSSVKEAINYYKLLKEKAPSLKTTVVVHPEDDNTKGTIDRIKGIREVINDYNNAYGLHYTISTYSEMKRDVALRLSHKEPYKGIANKPNEQLDMVIVVNQLLTGFDSKWVNTLYLDKVLSNEHIIQAFSRTNRIFGPEKPFGNIYYYRKPHTMEKLIAKAVQDYSGEHAPDVFVSKLVKNLNLLNRIYDNIVDIFETEGVKNFVRLPLDKRAVGKFAKEFASLNDCLDRVKVQGFTWDKAEYEDAEGKVTVKLTRENYEKLLQRYKDLCGGSRLPGNGDDEEPYDLNPRIAEIKTATIDARYMDSLFSRYLTIKQTTADETQTKEALAKVSNMFALLSQEDQRFANMFIWDVESGKLVPDRSKSISEYIADYKYKDLNNKIHRFSEAFGIDEDILKQMVQNKGRDINEYGRFEALKKSLDKTKAQEYFSLKEGKSVSAFKAASMFDQLARDFVEQGGLDLS